MIIYLHRHIFFHYIILFLLFFLLTACSSTRFIYTFLDEFIQDEIAYFIDLDEEEKILLDQNVYEVVNWHRTSMLPIYADYLNEVASKIEVGQYDDTDINKMFKKGQSIIEKTVIGLTPYASKFLMRHQNVEAIEFMKKKMLTRQQERIIELSKTKEVLYKNRLKKLTSNFERFIGDLSDSQVTLIEAHTRTTLNDSRVRLHNRTLRQKVFIRFLRTKPTQSELTTYLNKLLLNGYLITNPSYQTFLEVSLERFKKLMVNMLAISSTAQREMIVRKLKEYAKDFKDVSG